LALNHVSYADVYLASRALVHWFEPIRFLAKSEVRHVPIMGWMTTHFRTIYVDRERPERAAIAATIKAAKEGPVVIFPEGTRSRSLSLQQGKAGLGVVVRLSGVAVIPVSVVGTERKLWQLLLGWLVPGWRICLSLGDAYVPPPGMKAEAITSEVMRRIAANLPEGRRGVYGSRDATITAAQPDRRPIATLNQEK